MINHNSDLQQRINNLYNHLYGGSFKKTPQGISIEVGKVLHLCMYLEEKNKTILSADLNLNKATKSEIDAASSTLISQFEIMNKDWSFYEKEDSIKLSAFDLIYSFQQLKSLKFSDSSKDIFGDTIEIIRSKWVKQVGGQFFTDGLVTKLAMKLLQFDPRNGDDLIDICSGTGGFLLAGLNHIKDLLHSSGEQHIEKRLVKLGIKSLKGQEIDEDVCQIGNSSLATRLGKHAEPFISLGDSINPETFIKGKKIKYNKHKCVASNPPFGTKITIKDFNILNHYELAKQSNRNKEVTKGKAVFRAPDILFLEQNVKLLIPGEGRLSIVLPYQILSGPQAFYIREWIYKQTIILSVVDLPGETFQPHTGTKTCLLTVMRRKTPLMKLEESDHYSIFMSVPKWIGHDRRGLPLFSKLTDGKNSNEILTDFPLVEEAYQTFLQGNNPTAIHKESFIINSSSILGSEHLQLNALFYRPGKFDSINNARPKNNKWRFEPLGSLTKNIFFPGRFKRDYVKYFDGAVPFLGGSDINQMILSTDKWISPNHPKIEELSVRKDWLLITRSGSTGIISMVPEEWDGYAMSEHVIRIVPDEKKINPYYLLAFLRTQYCKEMISKGVFGSVIDEIDPNFIAKINVPIPQDVKALKRIVSKVKDAETARNEALKLTNQSINDQNLMFENELMS